MTSIYYAAACQTDFPCPASRDEIGERTSRMCTMAEQTIVGYEPFHDFPDYDAEPFPVVDTEIGRLGVAICYDWLFPETIRQIAFNGAEVIVRVSAYMDPWGATPPMDWWTLFNRARAAENTVYVVAANQGASLEHYPPFSWPGGSMVVDYDARILAQADPGPGEKVVVAPIDIAALRSERARRSGHDMRAHLRSEMHSYQRQGWLPPAAEHPIDMDATGERIEEGKAGIGQEASGGTRYRRGRGA